MTTRRSFLKISSAMTLAACPCCRATLAAEGLHWTYEHADEWSKLSSEFNICGIGDQQSPIDLDHPIPSALSELEFAWKPGPVDLLNNGHTIQVNVGKGSILRIGGDEYEMAQFHFHHPGEHTIHGARFAMEAHFVHLGKNGNAAVLGVFLVPGPENDTIAKIWAYMPKQEGRVRIDEAVDANLLVPQLRTYYRYEGSLTTPPCSETVTWTVLTEPIELSKAQIEAFATIYPMNARPLQKLNRRFLLGPLPG